MFVSARARIFFRWDRAKRVPVRGVANAIVLMTAATPTEKTATGRGCGRMDGESLFLVVRSIGGLSTCIVGVALALRMLRLARRTRQLPELTIGLHMVALVLGYLIEFAGMEIGSRHPSAGIWLRGTANLLYAVSIFVYLLFTWKVFAPASRWAPTLVAATTLALVVGWTGEVLTTDFGFSAARFAEPWFWIAFVPRMIGMGWASFEALSHHSRLRRRIALGLADPVAANRLLLWALAALFEWMIYLAVAITILAGCPDGFLTGDAALWVSAFGVAGASCMWFGFFPPQRYQRWVEDRAV